MRFVALLLIALLAGCASTSQDQIFATSATNLTETEIRSLPSGITFDTIEKRLRYYSHAEVAIPLIAFEIEGQKGRECMMLFDDAGRLRYAWCAASLESSPHAATIIWPRELADRKLSEIEANFTKRANQAPEPTPPLVTPREVPPV